MHLGLGFIDPRLGRTGKRFHGAPRARQQVSDHGLFIRG